MDWLEKIHEQEQAKNNVRRLIHAHKVYFINLMDQKDTERIKKYYSSIMNIKNLCACVKIGSVEDFEWCLDNLPEENQY